MDLLGLWFGHLSFRVSIEQVCAGLELIHVILLLGWAHEEAVAIIKDVAASESAIDCLLLYWVDRLRLDLLIVGQRVESGLTVLVVDIRPELVWFLVYSRLFLYRSQQPLELT